MKYLFFDLECSNCYGGVGKVCEFGAVLTDESFNVIDEISIPMSPGKKCGFDKTIYKRDPNFNWAYSFDYYYSCPEFPKYYRDIKKLMEDKDTLVFGYAVDNDIRYLFDSCKRYGLDPIEYNVFDIKLIRESYSKEKHEIRGLQGVCIELCDFAEIMSLTPHLAKDDAKMTMMALKAMCSNLEMNVLETIELCPNVKYNSKLYIDGYLFRKEDKKLHPEKYCRFRKTHPKSECQVAWGEFYKEYEQIKEDSKGKVVTISSKLKEDMNTLNSVIGAIKKKNLVASDRISDSNYLVVLDEIDKKRMEGIFKHPYNGTIVLLNDFAQAC